MKKKLLKIIIVGFLVLVGGIAGVVLVANFTQKCFERDSVRVTNITGNSFTVFWETDRPTVTKARVAMRDFNKTWEWQYDDRDDPKNPVKRELHHVTFSELYSKEDYVIEIADTRLLINIGQRFYKGEIETEQAEETIVGIPDRVYGYVSDTSGKRLDDGVVFLTIDDENYLSTVIEENGSYSFDVSKLDPPQNGNFLEKIEVVSQGYPTANFVAQSNKDRPVPEIEVEGNNVVAEEDVSWLRNLMTHVHASTNSCFKDGEIGGARIQCNINVNWMKSINVNRCPNPADFRVGLVAHKNRTFLYEPDVIKMRIEDQDGEVLIEDINNGGKVIKDRSEFDYGDSEETFHVVAYNSQTGEVCSDDGGKATVEFGAETPKYAIVNSSSGGSSSSNSQNSSGEPGTMPTVSRKDQSCKKYGENLASLPPISSSIYSKAATLGMNWTEAIIVSNDQVESWQEEVKKATSEGITPIMRICYKGVCDIENGSKYGREIADLYNSLLDSGDLPSEGLYIHAGHNEPNAAEYRSPSEEGQFISQVIEALQDADVPVSQNSDDASIKLLGPNMDLFTQQNTNSGSEGHPVYTAQKYLEKMAQHCEGCDQLYAMAANDYYITHDGTNFRDVKADVDNFIDYLDSSSYPSNVFITEIGKAKVEDGQLKHTDAMSWSEFGDKLAQLDSIEEVKAILLFNSLGLNKDKNFERYLKELWADPNIIGQELLSGCALDSVEPPNETADSNDTSGDESSGGSDGEVPVSTVEPTDGLYCGDFECAFVQWNGIPEIYLPSYWHAWWDEGSTKSGGVSRCGDFENAGDHFHCGRPEYGVVEKDMLANRAVSGQALQYFSTFRTHNAGVYTSVNIGSSESPREVTFKVKGHSWTAPDHNEYVGQVGIDPTGGVDRSNVVWGETSTLPDVDPHDAESWKELSVTTTVNDEESGETSPGEDIIVTLFIRGNNKWALRNNDAYWDEAKLFVDGKELVAQNVDFGIGSGINATAEMDLGLDKQSDPNITKTQRSLTNPGLPADELEDPGQYVLSSDKYHILLPHVSKFEDEDLDIKFYYDKNRNLKKDPDEGYVVDMGNIKARRVSDAVKYDLHQGFNFISFPMKVKGLDKASDFLNMIRVKGGRASSMSSYYSGYWLSYNDIGGYGYGEDFELIPGRGYIIKVEKPVRLEFDGAEFSDAVPFDLIEGWNLIAVHGSKDTSTAKALLNLIYEQSEINADNVSKWSSATQKYSGFYYDRESQKYAGEDFTLKENKSYFIRVREGEGIVEP